MALSKSVKEEEKTQGVLQAKQDQHQQQDQDQASKRARKSEDQLTASPSLLLQRNDSIVSTIDTTDLLGSTRLTSQSSPSTQDNESGGGGDATSKQPLNITSKKFSEDNLRILSQCYKENPNPSARCLREIAAKSGLTHLQCKAWFQYQRKKKRKHILENQSEKLYREIKVLVEDIEKAKERNVVLLTENNTLRKNVNQWNNVYHEQFGLQKLVPGGKTGGATAVAATAPIPTAKQVTFSVQGANLLSTNQPKTSTLQEARERLGIGDQNQVSPNSDSDQTQHRNGGLDALHQLALKSQQQQASSSGGQVSILQTTAVSAAKSLDVNTADVPGQIAANVSEHVKRASAVVTRVLKGEARNENPLEAVLHSNLAVHVRTLINHSENPLNIVTVLVKSFDSLIQSQKTDAEKETELKPLLDSFVKTELAIKDAQLGTKVNLMGQLPQLPPPNVTLLQQDASKSTKVTVESILCIFNMCYLGASERSLCMMGEASAHALFAQAYELINLENTSLPFQHIMLLNKLKDELKKEEEELVRKFEVSWHIPYAFLEKHHDSIMRSHLQSAMILASSGVGGGAGGLDKAATQGASEANPFILSMSRTMAEAVTVYKKGIMECYKKLPPLLCARVFLSMHKVKQILRTSDTFYQLPINAAK